MENKTLARNYGSRLTFNLSSCRAGEYWCYLLWYSAVEVLKCLSKVCLQCWTLELQCWRKEAIIYREYLRCKRNCLYLEQKKKESRAREIFHPRQRPAKFLPPTPHWPQAIF